MHKNTYGIYKMHKNTFCLASLIFLGFQRNLSILLDMKVINFSQKTIYHIAKSNLNETLVSVFK